MNDAGPLDDRIQDRQPPSSNESEMALLSAVLNDNRAYDRVSDFLRPEHFAFAQHRLIYEAAAYMIDNNRPADPNTLRGFFEFSDTLKDVGGAEYLVRLAAALVDPTNAKHYALTIRDRWVRRSLIRLLGNSRDLAYRVDWETSPDAGFLLGRLEADLAALSPEAEEDEGPVPFVVALDRALAHAEAAYKHDGAVIGVATGFAKIDKILGGLRPGQLMLLAGRPKMGKTALAFQIARHVAEVQGKKVFFATVEMSIEELVTREISKEIEVPVTDVYQGNVTAAHFAAMVQARERLKAIPLLMDDNPDNTILGVQSKARRVGAELVVLDYLQLVDAAAPGQRYQTDVQRVTAISRACKKMARRLEIPVLALSQLSRQVEQRDDKRPVVSDLRDSGALEQDADKIVFLYRHEHYISLQPQRGSKENEATYDARVLEWHAELAACRGKAEVIVAAQRQGPTGRAMLEFEAKFTRFSEPDPTKESNAQGYIDGL